MHSDHQGLPEQAKARASLHMHCTLMGGAFRWCALGQVASSRLRLVRRPRSLLGRGGVVHQPIASIVRPRCPHNLATALSLCLPLPCLCAIHLRLPIPLIPLFPLLFGHVPAHRHGPNTRASGVSLVCPRQPTPTPHSRSDALRLRLDPCVAQTRGAEV